VLEIHRRTGYLLLATLVAQVILISAQVKTTSGTRVLQAVTFGVFSQVQLGTAWVFGGVRSVWDGYFALRGAHEENQRLRDALASTQVKLLEKQALAQRAVQLEQVLALRQRTPLQTVAASVIAGDATGIFRTLTIDKGSSSGLRKDMAVIAPQGVVGRIVEPPPLYAAKVQLIIDHEAGAGAVIERSGVGGVVIGNDRQGEPQLMLDFVSNLSDAKVGDRLVTSGLDGIFPRGVTIGWLARVDKGSGLYKRIWVSPAVDFASVDSVLVVLEPPQTLGPSPADTSAAAIAAAAARKLAVEKAAAALAAAQAARPAATPGATATGPAPVASGRPSGAPGPGTPASTAPASPSRPAAPRPVPPERPATVPPQNPPQTAPPTPQAEPTPPPQPPERRR
jgi:rod shape-determining protein MreC